MGVIDDSGKTEIAMDTDETGTECLFMQCPRSLFATCTFKLCYLAEKPAPTTSKKYFIGTNSLHVPRENMEVISPLKDVMSELTDVQIVFPGNHKIFTIHVKYFQLKTGICLKIFLNMFTKDISDQILHYILF